MRAVKIGSLEVLWANRKVQFSSAWRSREVLVAENHRSAKENQLVLFNNNELEKADIIKLIGYLQNWVDTGSLFSEEKTEEKKEGNGA